MRPVDRLLVWFNAGFGVLWLLGLGRANEAWIFAAGHALAIALAILAARLDRAGAFGRAVRSLYPVAMVAALWFEVGAVRETFHAGAFDAPLLAAERALLGIHLHQTWMPAMPAVWLSELMYAAYTAYYPLVFLTPVILYARRHPDLDRLVFRIALAYTACYASYALFPVDGPLFTMTPAADAGARGVIYRLLVTNTAGGDALGAAFPSSHVAGSVAVALFALRWMRRPWGVTFSLLAAGVALSAVYTQRHYFADVVAGAALAALLHYGGASALERWWGAAPPPARPTSDG
jgi:membrane-associated phospholipid phosphatase